MTSNLITAFGCALALGLIGTAAHAQQMGDPTMPPPPGDHAGGPGGGPGGDHPHGGRGFDAMDANHDGFVTMDEWTAAGRRPERFAKIDTDHDGKITREEMHAAMEKMRAMHEQNGGGGPGGMSHDGPPPSQ